MTHVGQLWTMALAFEAMLGFIWLGDQPFSVNFV